MNAASKPVNYYAVLGVPPASSAEELHQAYKALALKHHPDKGGEHSRFAKITLAYTLLKSPEARHKYDAQLALLGQACETCKGKGLVYKQVSYSTRQSTICKSCKGAGYL